MRLLKCEAHNFGSYKHLEIDFSNAGLALIYGPTGAGKSTLPDLGCWVLYGQTAKGGAADDVRSWTSQEDTVCTLEVELNETEKIVVTRQRGQKNDLFWQEGRMEGNPKRGKDLSETQRMLERRLGVSADLYLTGAYFSEFSGPGSFFMAKAKERRALFETVADLSFAVTLAEKTSNEKKSTKKDRESTESKLSGVSGQLEQLKRDYDYAVQSSEEWEADHIGAIQRCMSQSKGFELEKASKIESLQTKYDAFEADKNRKIDDLLAKLDKLEPELTPLEMLDQSIEEAKAEAKCPKCGALTAKGQKKLDALKDKRALTLRNTERYNADQDRLRELYPLVNPFISQIADAKKLENTYDAQLRELKQQVDPFSVQIAKFKDALLTAEDTKKTLESKLEALTSRLAQLDRLYDLSYVLRGELLRRTVQEIETETNRQLEKYFDAEIRVKFTLEGADNLDVVITKSGYHCNFRQLSKGQRGLLKLCFVTSVMKAASNRSGVHFDNLWFDEALDGLDNNLKLKAFPLLQALSKDHQSVFVIDHCPEFQSMFDVRYKVTLDADNSQIEVLNG
jgi:DNA repair exonuclease SbcCD ATPase subunit